MSVHMEAVQRMENRTSPHMFQRVSPTVLLVLLSAVLLHACRRDPAWPVDTPEAGPTPYNLSIPAWGNDGIHPLQLPGDNPLTVEGVELGRMLFHERALSDDFSFSCATCHMQDHGFAEPHPVSLGTDGSLGRRNAPALVNLAWHETMFWDGRAANLEAQAFGPVTNPVELRNTWPSVVERLQADPRYPQRFQRAFGTEIIDSVLVVKAIAQFERTLLSFNSRFDRWFYQGDAQAMNEQEQRGFQLFMNEAKCNNCHAPPHFHDFSLRNIGMLTPNGDTGQEEVTGDPMHRGRFKTPTLRNIEVTWPYMHDGRFYTLEEVVDFYADDVLSPPNLDPHMIHFVNGEVVLSPQDRSDLVAFMKTLTDPAFLAEPLFSDPH